MMKHSLKHFGLIFLLITLQGFAQQKIILGRVESVKVLPQNIRVEAKLDTGAYQSSLHAEGIKEYVREGKAYVTFKYPKLGSNQFYQFDLPVYKEVKIKKRTADIRKDGKMYTRRPVVKLHICLAGRVQDIEVNLTDRGHFKQKMLIGRRSMQLFSVMIDPSKTYLTLPNCG